MTRGATSATAARAPAAPAGAADSASFAEGCVKAQLSTLVDQVEDTHDRVLITRNGKPAAILISPEELESLEETLEILSDPAAMKRIRKAQREVESGDVLDEDALRELIASRSTRAKR